ncbi:hypothetical protein ISF_04480 [Cordyceps fumosorosea ARSEF 2679]|uniref:Uncharacterized protein n=1 Tax=Cordyceps fumosorosea (strain ARSEF 2679) TaxID=1081104 RepID=A0A162MPY5_CORFA|nr:hypothetical protein ISF_04480 [Cordyceps fumosorosea ARSEF 2679]OAA65070.1 hypothetical protein ISF_04480 [Cordyceps fumosorosea ARSEF 2679]
MFNRNKTAILLETLSRDFSPFEELLQVYTAAADDIDCCPYYQPRTVLFKRFPDDTGHTIGPQPGCINYGANYSAESNKPSTTIRKVAGAATRSVAVLTEDDLRPVLRMCRVVRRWEQLFPQMRWFYYPEACRTLRAQELPRFRRAFYRWWLYGTYFHGEWTRPQIGHPIPFVLDVRVSQMRRYSTAELMELLDLHETMKDVILHYICPRLDPTYQLSHNPAPLMEKVGREHSLKTTWNDQSKWARIVKTYAKLGPEELMHYFENIYSYTRKRLIAEIRLERPTFTFDQESLQGVIRCVLEERQLVDNLPIIPGDCEGGILDFDDERDVRRMDFEQDGRVDGTLPPGVPAVQQFSRHSPRGDDGEYLEEELHSVFDVHGYTAVLQA